MQQLNGALILHSIRVGQSVFLDRYSEINSVYVICQLHPRALRCDSRIMLNAIDVVKLNFSDSCERRSHAYFVKSVVPRQQNLFFLASA